MLNCIPSRSLLSAIQQLLSCKTTRLGSVILRIQKTYENVGLKLCYNYATGFGVGQENKNEGNHIVMVPRGGIEPPTRGFSIAELTDIAIYINALRPLNSAML